MAHRRKHRHHVRENPLSDTTKIVLAVGVTAAVVGVGYYLYKRQSGGGVSLLQPNVPQGLPALTDNAGSTPNNAGSTPDNAGSTPDNAGSATNILATAMRAIAAPYNPNAPRYDFDPNSSNP
jgi:hypothetical protein